MSKPTTIRLSEKDREDAEKKADEYGLPSISALIRFAIKRLPNPRK